MIPIRKLRESQAGTAGTSMERKRVRKLRMPNPPHPGLTGTPSQHRPSRHSLQTRWMNSRNGASSPVRA